MKKPTADKFTTQLVNLKQERIVGGYASSGGRNGRISPGDVAEELFGDTMSGAHLFAYLFRRFGYPNIGWDPYKNLVTYALTTPMPGLYLSVTPYLGDNTSIHFGILYNKKVQRWLNEDPERDKEMLEMDKWARANLLACKRPDERESLFDFTDKDGKPDGYMLCLRRPEDKDIKQSSVWLPKPNSRNWGMAMKVIYDIHNKLHPESREDKDRRMAEYSKPWHQKDPQSKVYQVHAACKATLEDLLTPTYVRDIYLNAIKTGDDLVEEMEEGDDSERYSYYEHAGIAGKLACKPDPKSP